MARESAQTHRSPQGRAAVRSSRNTRLPARGSGCCAACLRAGNRTFKTRPFGQAATGSAPQQFSSGGLGSNPLQNHRDPLPHADAHGAQRITSACAVSWFTAVVANRAVQPGSRRRFPTDAAPQGQKDMAYVPQLGMATAPKEPEGLLQRCRRSAANACADTTQCQSGGASRGGKEIG